jgi:hypothetical protein
MKLTSTLLTILVVFGALILCIFWNSLPNEVGSVNHGVRRQQELERRIDLRARYAEAERYFVLSQVAHVKVGIAAMVTCSPNFEFWLDFHLNYLKIDLIVLGIEDCHEYAPLLKPYGSRIHATFHDREDINITDNYHSMMPRQNATVTRGLKLAKQHDVKFLFHIDADELLYVGPAPNLPISNDTTEHSYGKSRHHHPPTRVGVHRSVLLRKHLMDVEETYSNIHLHNWEAAYPTVNYNDSSKCFDTDKFLECSYLGKCKMYVNGKSAGRVDGEGWGHWLGGVKWYGPHAFSGRTYQMPSTRLSVLHFDSCTFEQYVHKFSLLAQAGKDRLDKIPFPYYKQTIWQWKHCEELKAAGKDRRELRECRRQLRTIYHKNKVKPYSSWRARHLQYM